ncbi:MAG: NAD(P)H-dependent oxidoreductase [Kaiparowitsia implicata GSE-PSE-MK54-09C]|jgi:glutathione-regulated potassium-efflux system ancillary protein KefG|nr:NAD(P)H-dependent oxidoreductase [Kaiparowitsia implicata GSE-PSE-MK54-09C]
MKNALVILAHPNFAESRGNQALIEAIQTLPSVKIQNLYEQYPNWQIDVPVEQELLRHHDLIVLQYPLQWYSVPPLLKKWMDDVLTYGFAFGTDGISLQGKELMPVVTAGGTSDMYIAGGAVNFTISEFLRPIQQTAHYCGITYKTPFVVHGLLPKALAASGTITDEQLLKESKRYQHLLQEYIAS